MEIFCLLSAIGSLAGLPFYDSCASLLYVVWCRRGIAPVRAGAGFQAPGIGQTGTMDRSQGRIDLEGKGRLNRPLWVTNRELRIGAEKMKKVFLKVC